MSNKFQQLPHAQALVLKRTLSQSYIDAINQDYALAKRIFDKTGSDDLAIVTMINNSTIIAMCIKYETFASELWAKTMRRKVNYNRPWYYTRSLAEWFKLDLTAQYQAAHDAWEYYNALKHVNGHSVVASLNFSQNYDIKDSWAALRFVYRALIALLEKFA